MGFGDEQPRSEPTSEARIVGAKRGQEEGETATSCREG